MKYPIQTFPSNTRLPDPNWPGVFVFGANAQGIHGAGAAVVASRELGYPQGVHDRLIGGAYGIATKAAPHGPDDLAVLGKGLPALGRAIREHPDLVWNLTRLGTGLASLPPEAVAWLLAPLAAYPNVRFDAAWEPLLAGVKVYAFTGHRRGFDSAAAMRGLRRAVRQLRDKHPHQAVFMSGMAQGADQLGVLACLDAGVPWIAAVPFMGQDTSWPHAARSLYQTLLGQAGAMVVVSQASGSRAYIERDRYMVEHAAGLIAVYDGRREGGTFATLQMARQRGVPVYNVLAHA